MYQENMDQQCIRGKGISSVSGEKKSVVFQGKRHSSVSGGMDQ